MTTAYPLRTDRLVLRLLGEADVDPLTAYRNDPQVAALQDWELPYPRSRAVRLVASQAGRDDVAPGAGTQIGIERDRELVGDVYVGLAEQGGVAEVGCTLGSEHQGRGYALEALAAVVDDLVERHGVHRVTGQLSPQNDASARLLERLGMRLETIAPASYWWRGAWDDNLVYAMSAEERRAWRDRPRTSPEKVRLVALTAENHRGYASLGTHRSQERFVATVAQSFGDALFPGEQDGQPLVPVLLGIEADGEPAGFVMYAAAGPSRPEPYLWRFLVDRRHQGRGIGRRALQALVEQARSEDRPGMLVSWVPGRGGPEGFYRSAGFVPTGTVEAGEVVARLDLAGDSAD
jgi:RimJ/RimL family protein N-acetyltransferase